MITAISTLALYTDVIVGGALVLFVVVMLYKIFSKDA